MDANGQAVAVLVAIAPGTITVDHPDDTPDMYHHHLPQMSTGKGFYLPKTGAYCFTFGTQCAPVGATTLTGGHGYPGSKGWSLLNLNKDNTSWTWQGAAANNLVLILPMPDYYSYDGIWPNRFRAVHDISQTSVTEYDAIGLTLHYNNGPSYMGLLQCDGSTSPSVKTCSTTVKDSDGYPQILTNTSTLRLQMRAPDLNDACDHHVRHAYFQILSLIDPNSTANAGRKDIEPAKGMRYDDSGMFESPGNQKCFDMDHPAENAKASTDRQISLQNLSKRRDDEPMYRSA